MADFVEVMKIKRRMCESIKGCYLCPVSMSNNGTLQECKVFLHLYPEEAQELLLKWDREHSAKTNADKFEEVFGFMPTNRCPHLHDEICHKSSNCSECPRYGFWNKEYVKPKEKAND